MDIEEEDTKLSIDDLDFEELDPITSEEELDESTKNGKTVSEKSEGEDPDKDKGNAGEEEEEVDDSDKKKSEETDDDSDEEDPDEGDDTDEKPIKEDEPRVVDTVLASIGLELDEEEMEGIEDSEEGLAKLVDVSSKKLAESRYNEMVEASPNVKALYEFEERGGSPEDFVRTFYPPVDYGEVQLDEENTDMQKNIIAESLRSKGLSNERIQRNLQAIEDSGNLLDESKDSLTDLRETQKQEKQRILKENEQYREQQAEKAEESWKEVKTIISNGEVKGLPISEKKKKEFEKFITPDPKTGKSPRDEKVETMGVEDSLAIDLILMHGFDGLMNLVEKKVTSKVNGSLKDKLKSNKQRSKSDVQDPDLDKDTHDVEDLVFRIDE